MSPSARRVTLIPTIAAIVLFALIHAARWFDGGWLVGYDAGGTALALISWVALLCLILQAWLARRDRFPSWVVGLPAALVLLIGSLGVRWEMRLGRELLQDEPVEVGRRFGLFSEVVGGALTDSVLASALGALALVHATWLVALRARTRTDARGANNAAILTTVAAIATVAWMFAFRAGRDMTVRPGGITTPAITLLASGGMVLAAAALSDRASGDETGDRKSWQDVLVAGLCAVGSVALAAVCGHLRPLAAASIQFNDESIDLAQRELMAFDAMQVARNEVTLGLVAAGALIVVTTVVLVSRVEAATRVSVLGALGLTASVLGPSALVIRQADRAMTERQEYREGELGELVEDATLEPGTLAVDLAPLIEGVDLGWSTAVKLSSAVVRQWNPGVPATFTHLPTDRPLSVQVDNPYLAHPAGPYKLPRYKGARLRIGVLRLAPQPRPRPAETDRWEPEKILHVDATDPSMFRLKWASGRVVHVTHDVPRSAKQLAASVAEDWKLYGSHKNDNDRKFDTVLIHYLEPESFDNLVLLARAVTRQQRILRGGVIAAFNVYLFPDHPSGSRLDEQVDPSKLSSLEPEHAAAQAQQDLVRCQGSPCVAGPLDDPLGTELRRACNQPVCSALTVAGLYLRLGEALASLGDNSNAAAAFSQSTLLNPNERLDAQASAAAWEAFRAAGVFPRGSVRQGAMTVSGRLSPQVIAEGVRERVGFFRRCYGQALRTQPALSGRVAMRFVIGRDGTATEPGNGGSDLPNAEVLRCVLRSAGGMTFPPPEGGIVTVVVPFMFSPH